MAKKTAKKTKQITMRNCPNFSKPKKRTPNQIRKLRKSIPMSQAAFSGLFGISPNTVKAWEQGRRKPLSSALRLMELLEKLGVRKVLCIS